MKTNTHVLNQKTNNKFSLIEFYVINNSRLYTCDSVVLWWWIEKIINAAEAWVEFYIHSLISVLYPYRISPYAVLHSIVYLIPRSSLISCPADFNTYYSTYSGRILKMSSKWFAKKVLNRSNMGWWWYRIV